MISKPPSHIYYESGTIEAARRVGDAGIKTLSTVNSGLNRLRALISIPIFAAGALVSGWAALAAGVFGGNLPMAAIAACSSLAMGWVALRSVRVVLGGTRSNRSGSSPVPYGASSGSWQETWANNGQIARNTGITGRGGESSICYSRAKLFIFPLLLFPLCLLVAFALNSHMHWHMQNHTLVLTSLMLALLVGVRSLLIGASGDLTAISWDDHQIRVRTLSASRQVPWEAVEALQIRHQALRVLGIIPVYRRATGLVIRLRHNGSRRKMIIPAFALPMSPAAAAAMIGNAASRRVPHRAAPSMPVHDAEGGEVSRFGRKTAAEPDLRASEPVTANVLDAAERTGTFGDYNSIAGAPRANSIVGAPRVFGKKVV